MGSVADAVMSIRPERTEGDFLANEGLGQLPHMPLEGDVGLCGTDAANNVVGGVFGFGDCLRIGSGRGPIAACGTLEAQVLMRALVIIDGPPVVEGGKKAAFFPSR
jgi:hypothetical protein